MNKTSEISPWFKWGVPVGILGLWGLTPLVVGYLAPGDAAGPYGDRFGAINALFTGLAFWGVILTVLLQRQELREQREELSLTREEIAGQRIQLELQNRTLYIQQFENTFFQLLRLLRDLVTNATVPSPNMSGDNTRGSDAFLTMHSGYLWRDDRIRVELPNAPIAEAYRNFYGNFQHILGPYFGLVRSIVTLVDQSTVNDKGLYTNLLRVQFSPQELVILFYEASTQPEQRELKALVEKYSLLKHLPIANSFPSVERRKWLDPSAYGPN